MSKKLKGIYFAALSTLGFALTPILAKKGLVGISPLVGGTVSVAAGILCFCFVLLFSGAHRGLFGEPRAAIVFYVFAGISNTLAIALFYKALQLSPAVIVVPFTSTFPLITIVLSYFFLGKEERLNLKILVGALLIMGGTVLMLSSG